MASLKCTGCGHRIFLPASAPDCPNCGTLLPGTTASVPSSSTPPLTISDVFGFSSGSTISGSTEPIEIVANNYQARSKSSLQQRNGNILADIFSPPPKLEGVVISLQTQVETNVQRDWILGILAIIGNFVWAIFVSTTTYESTNIEERRSKSVTMVRLQTPDGEQHDVRVEGDLQGGGIMQGDKLSFWGRLNKGTLFVSRGYNHTSNAVVYTNKRWPLAFSILVPLVLILLIVLVLYFLHPFALFSPRLGG